MPIGDLLAQISGDGSSSSNPAPTIPRVTSLPKRKADDDMRSVGPKTPRTTTPSTTVAPSSSGPLQRPRQNEGSNPSSKSSMPSRPLDRPNLSQRPANSQNGVGSKPSVLSSKPMNGANKVQKPAVANRPSPGPSNAPVPSRPPKKGSFAEILARGQRAQVTMGQVGKIQHKKVAKGTTTATTTATTTTATPAAGRKDDAKVDPRAMKKKASVQASGYTGTAKPGQRNGTPVTGNPRDGRNGKAVPATKAERVKAAAEQEKKMKKAAVATTGYTGTARPKPGGAVKKNPAARGGALLNTQPARKTTSRSRHEEEYDEDLDDFIDYDDEDDDEGPRYDYASDASSDMEAGLDDIDVEERRAEQIARREDIEEERLEASLRAAKERKKQQLLESLRANRRR